MDLNSILSTDKPVPAAVVDETSRVTDEKPESEALEHSEEAAASSAAKDEKSEAKSEVKPEDKADDKNVARDEKGRFTPKAEEREDTDGRTVALRAERERRRAAEERLREFEAAKPKTSVFDDEDKAISERVDAQLLPLRQKFFNLSLKAARYGREDYDEISQVFAEAADKDPRLAEQLRSHDDPGEFVYSVGKQIRELADVGGDISKYRQKVESESKAKIGELETRLKALEAENKALKESKEKQQKVPQSLNSEQSATAKGEQFAGPKPLKSILS